MEEDEHALPPLLSKKTKIILAIIAGCILIGISLVAYEINVRTIEIKTIEKEVQWFQCRTLCPTEVKTLSTNTGSARSRMFEASCEIYCKKKYISPSKEAISKIFERTNTRTQQLAKFTREFALCGEHMQRDLDFDHAQCFSHLFARYPSLITRKNLTLEEYPQYPSFVPYLVCNPEPVLFINLTAGTPEKGTLDFQILRENSAPLKMKGNLPPLSGETKNYTRFLNGSNTENKILGIEIYYREENNSYFIDGASCTLETPETFLAPEVSLPEEPFVEEEILSQELLPEEIIPDETLPEESLPEEIPPEGTSPHNPLPGETSGEDLREEPPSESPPEELPPEELPPEDAP